MRRYTAITLLLLMLAAILAPAGAATVTTPMPACCRVTGAHHCSTVIGATGGEPQLQGQSCPHRKPVACTGCAAQPPAAETVAPANAHSFSSEFQPEFFVSLRKLPYSQRAPPSTSSVK